MVVRLRRFGGLPLALVVLAALGVSATPQDHDRLVARSDGGRIFFRMIACSAESKQCHADEQKRLARRIHRLWIRAALKKYGVALTPEEEQVVARQTATAESHIQASAARFRALYEAAVRVRRGEDRATIDAELAKSGILAHDLDVALQYVRSLTDAERAAAKDQVAEVRQAVQESYAQPFLLDHLREFVEKRAAAEKVPFAVAEERFWSEIARTINTQIIDPAYTMPDRKGILVKR